MTVILVLNLVWAAAGLIAGYVAGWIVHYRRNGRAGNGRAVLGLGILILVGVSTLLNYKNAQQTADNTVALKNEVECQRQFNLQYRNALAAQLEASQKETAAQKQFLTTFAGGNPTPEARQLAYQNYFAQYDAAEKLRNVPLPVVNPCGAVS